MDTQDPRFINAYNDLTASFFRFMNVVNPAPSTEAQIQLICQSMQSIVDTLRQAGTMSQGQPAVMQPQMPVTQPVVNQQPSAQPVVTQPVQAAPAAPVAPAPVVWEEKRYAPMPSITSEDIYKFMFKQLKREEAFQGNSDEAPMINDYFFILEFTGTEGIFTLNGDLIMSQVRDKEIPADLIKVEGVMTADSTLTVKAPGKIEKSTGGWEVKKPIIIISQ